MLTALTINQRQVTI